MMNRKTALKAMTHPSYGRRADPLHDFTTRAVRTYFDATYADNAPETRKRDTPLDEPGRRAAVEQSERRRLIAQADAERDAAHAELAAFQATTDAERKAAHKAQTQARRREEHAARTAWDTAPNGGRPRRETLGRDAFAPAEVPAGLKRTGASLGAAPLRPSDAPKPDFGFAPIRIDDPLSAVQRVAPTSARSSRRERMRDKPGRADGNNRYGYIADDPATPQDETEWTSLDGWARALREGFETGWHGDPTRNPRLKRSGRDRPGDTRRNGPNGATTTGPKPGPAMTAIGPDGRKRVPSGPTFDHVKTRSRDSGASSRVICTELVRQGMMAPALQRLDIAFTLKHLSPTTVRGYHAWAVPYVRLMRRSRLATHVMRPIATWRAREIAYRMGERVRPCRAGKVVRAVMEPLCWLIGRAIERLPGDADHFHPYMKNARR